jgi:hypothetical protein
MMTALLARLAGLSTMLAALPIRMLATLATTLLLLPGLLLPAALLLTALTRTRIARLLRIRVLLVGVSHGFLLAS